MREIDRLIAYRKALEKWHHAVLARDVIHGCDAPEPTPEQFDIRSEALRHMASRIREKVMERKTVC